MTSSKNKHGILLSLMLLCVIACSSNFERAYKLQTQGLTVFFSSDGEIKSLTVKGKKFTKPVSARTTISGSRQDGQTIVKKTNDGAISFERTLVHDSLQKSCVLIDKFTPTSNSIRWELSVKGIGEPWGSVIRTRIHYPVDKSTLYWSAWTSPQYNSSNIDESLAKRLKKYPGGHKRGYLGLNDDTNFWMDPLIGVPFSDAKYYYGQRDFNYDKKREQVLWSIAYLQDIFCIPMSTVIEPERGVGITFALSPKDEIIDLTMDISAQGDIVFDRLNNRISAEHECLFSLDITAHDDDWRPALAWMCARYPEYFYPVNPQAHLLGGTGAYSNHYGEFDTDKMKKMCFTVNWQASFDFPYMGMFLPPVDKNESWHSFNNVKTSMKAMNDYAAEMKAKGFFVINYFNATEFGNFVEYPVPKIKITNENELWKDCNTYLYTKLSNAIVARPDTSVSKPEYMGATPPEPWYSWEGCIVMDCGDPAYHDFLLEQARRHVKELPDASGVCIDRMDWLRLTNERADDGVTWYKGKPVRSLLTSWKRLMEDLGPVFHDAGKYILGNCEVKRIDILKQMDGIFCEFGYAGGPINTGAFLCINKPALAWTDHLETVKTEGGDFFFQKYLYMGVFPMCPFPDNDHSILPDAEVDQIYLDYGPLMKLMQSRQWVLAPHAVSVENNLAKANIFKIPEGYSVPVVYGETDKVCVKIANIEELSKQTTCVAYYPGKEKPVELEMSKTGNIWSVDVPLERGCAMLKLTAKY